MRNLWFDDLHLLFISCILVLVFCCPIQRIPLALCRRPVSPWILFRFPLRGFDEAIFWLCQYVVSWAICRLVDRSLAKDFIKTANFPGAVNLDRRCVHTPDSIVSENRAEGSSIFIFRCKGWLRKPSFPFWENKEAVRVLMRNEGTHFYMAL